MTPAAFRTLLAHLLAGASGGTEARWHELIGEVRTMPISLSPRSTWQLVPRDTIKQRRAIARAEEVVRGEHPYVEAEAS